MKAEMTTVRASSGVRCRGCKDKLIKKGERVLKVSVLSSASARTVADSFYCLIHAKEFQEMFSKLEI